VCFHLELDLHGVLSGPRELHWTSLMAILQQQMKPSGRTDASPQALIQQWLTFDLTNPLSIMACVTRARNNARSIRGTISPQMWTELNKLYWQLSDPDFSSRALDSPHEFYQAVECGSHLFQGVCDATLSHDEGWQFIQVGKLLERADKTLRILDIQYQVLRELSDPANLSLSNLEWAGVLRSCRAYEAYQRLYVGRVEPERVVEFLLLQPDFPRSVRFSLAAAADALAAIEGPGAGREMSTVERILGRVLSDLKYSTLDEILRNDLHTFLSGVCEHCARVSLAVQEQYSLH
jgi:uncharacterized alpha-E superfamily protein